MVQKIEVETPGSTNFVPKISNISQHLCFKCSIYWDIFQKKKLINHQKYVKIGDRINSLGVLDDV